MEKNSSDFLNKLNDLNTLASRRDFNPDILNRFFVKSINSLYSAIYGKAANLEKYLNEDYQKIIEEEAKQMSAIFKYDNLVVKIESLDLIDQSVEGISFVSSLTLRVKISLFYKREFIASGVVREVKEVIEESIFYKNEDTGWKIKKKFSKDIIESAERIVQIK